MIDLTGDPVVEEQIRQYYIRKKSKEEQQKVLFVEGVATEPRRRADFTIDNTDVLQVSAKDMDSYKETTSKAWSKYYKSDKTRKRYEDQQIINDYSN